MGFIRRIIRRWNDVTAHAPTATHAPLDPSEPITPSSLERLRDAAQDLSTAMSDLNDGIVKTVIADQVSKEMDERLLRLELAYAATIQGTKNQIRRTRHAGAFLWAVSLALTGFATIQIHDAHINSCMIDPAPSSAKTYACRAVFPFTSHENMDLVRLGLSRVSDLEGDDVVHRETGKAPLPIPPQAIGMAFYVTLFGAAGFGAVHWRRRSKEESSFEIADISNDELDTLTAAQEHGAVHISDSKRDTP